MSDYLRYIKMYNCIMKAERLKRPDGSPKGLQPLYFTMAMKLVYSAILSRQEYCAKYNKNFVLDKKQIAEDLGFSKGNVRVGIERLEEAGLLKDGIVLPPEEVCKDFVVDSKWKS